MHFLFSEAPAGPMSMTKLHRIAVLGAGAMGCLFGGRLCEAGYELILIDVNELQIDAINRNGLQLLLNEDRHHIRVRAGYAHAFSGVVDLLIAFTKTHQLSRALDSVVHLVGPHTWVLTLQNGLDNGDTIARVVSRDRVAIGMTDWPADLRAPGIIASHGQGSIVFWSLSGEANEALESIERALNRAGLRASTDLNVRSAIWEKAAFNAAMNTISAITGFQVRQMADSGDIREIAHEVAIEAVATARALGIEADEQRIMAALANAYATHRQHEPSMLKDIRAGQSTEIDSINGAIVEHAKRLGVATPVTQTLARLVRAIQARTQGPRL